MINVSYWPMLIGALYMLVFIFGGAVIVLMIVGWINGRRSKWPLTGKSTLYETQPIEPSNYPSTRCPSCSGPTNPRLSDCTMEWCATWKRGHALKIWGPNPLKIWGPNPLAPPRQNGWKDPSPNGG